MQKAHSVFGITLILAAFAPAARAADSAPRQVVDRVVAVIENDIITLRELQAKAQPFLAEHKAATGSSDRDNDPNDVLRRVLDIEISERLVSRELERNKDKLGVGDKDVDKAVDEVLKLNHINREQLQQALYGQGLTWAEYRDKLRQQIERARLMQFKMQGKVQIKDADVRRRCLDRQRADAREVLVCASHVLLKIPPHASPAQVEALQGRAAQLQAELAAGADFAAYAMRHSQDQGAPDGSLGCFGKGAMVEPFEKAAFALPVGGVSPVVRTEFGLHIIKVNDRRAAAAPSCDGDAALEPFRNEVYQEEVQRQMGTWVEELRRKAFVDVRL